MKLCIHDLNFNHNIQHVSQVKSNFDRHLVLNSIANASKWCLYLILSILSVVMNITIGMIKKMSMSMAQYDILFAYLSIFSINKLTSFFYEISTEKS